MSVNVKLGTNTLNGVDTIKLKDADITGQYDSFFLRVSGTYRVTFKNGNNTYAEISVLQGNSLYAPTAPVNLSQGFIGWSSTNGGSPDITFPYTPSGDTTLYACFQTWSCTVAGLGSEYPSSVTFTHSGTMPTFELVTVTGNKFIKIPTMYRKVNKVQDGEINSYTISTGKIDNTYEPYSVFVKEDGTTVMDYVLIGKFYSNSSTVMNSVNTTVAHQRIGNARTNARALGSGYQLYDWQFQKLWQDLITCKKNTININNDGGIQIDELGIYWGNNSSWVDGLAIPEIDSGSNWIFSLKPSSYIDSPTASSTDYQSAGYVFPTTSSAIIGKLGYDSSFPFFNQPSWTRPNDTYTFKYYCNSWSYNYQNQSHALRSNPGSENRFSYNGAFSSDCSGDNNWTDIYTARLCYRPI